MSTTLEIDVHSRWDAVQLFGGFTCYHAHLVQLEDPDGRWLVRLHTPGLNGEGIVDALAVVERWEQERDMPDIGVCIVGRTLDRDDLAGLSFSGDLGRGSGRALVQAGTSL